MSERNDKAFAEYMVRLAKKMLAREQKRKAVQSYMLANHGMNAASLLALATNANQALAQHYNNLQAQYAMNAASQMTSKTMSETNPNVTEDEMAVIRAYFNGDDVLTTILSQER